MPSSAAWNSATLLMGAGQSAGAKTRYLTGQLSNVQLYDRALSGTDAGTLTTAGRTASPLDSKPSVTSYALDQRGLPTSMTDPDGNVTGYSYDEAGQLAVTTQPSVAAWMLPASARCAAMTRFTVITFKRIHMRAW